MITFAKTARPEGCAIAWATKTEIFVEIPCKDAPPMIVRYHKTTKGLAEALNVMVENEAKAPTYLATHPKVRRPVGNYSPDMREAARNALKRLKIT